MIVRPVDVDSRRRQQQLHHLGAALLRCHHESCAPILDTTSTWRVDVDRRCMEQPRRYPSPSRPLSVENVKRGVTPSDIHATRDGAASHHPQALINRNPPFPTMIYVMCNIDRTENVIIPISFQCFLFYPTSSSFFFLVFFRSGNFSPRETPTKTAAELGTLRRREESG